MAACYTGVAPFSLYFRDTKSAGPWFFSSVTARLHQVSVCNAVMTLAILLSLNTMESLQNGLQSYSGVTQLFSMRAVSIALPSVDADAWYK